MSANEPARLHSSRRSLLTSAAAGILAGAATFTVKAASISGSVAGSAPAEGAAAIKAEYLAARPRYLAASLLLEEHWPEYIDLVCSNGDKALPDEEHHALVAAYAREHGIDRAHDEQEQAVDEIQALSRRARSLPAGADKIAIMAFLLKDWTFAKFWEKPEPEREWLDLEVTLFVDAILADAGRV